MHLEISITEAGCQVTQVNNGIRETKTTDIASVVTALGNQVDLDTGYLDPTVIRFARTNQTIQILSLDRSRMRTLRYRDYHNRDTRDAREYLEFHIPTPNTLFHMWFSPAPNQNGYTLSQTRLYCVGNELVIGNDTPIYTFPFSNVNPSGSVCWGNTPVHAVIYQLNNGPTDIINQWWGGAYNRDLDHGRHTLTLFQELNGMEEYPVNRLERHRTIGTARNIITGG
jgi:hypothetical protein